MKKNSIRKLAQRAHDDPEKCESCGAIGPTERHHPDYAQPLRVEHLCAPCHVQADIRDGHRRVREPRRCVVCGREFIYRHSSNKTCGSPICLQDRARLGRERRWARHREARS